MILRILRHAYSNVIVSAAVILLVLSLMPYLHDFWWVFELPVHFYPHIALASAAVALLALITKSWRAMPFAVIAASLCWNTVATVPVFPSPENSGVIMVTQNLYLANGHVDKARRMFVDENPDVVVLQEYTPEWHEALRSVADQYQFTVTIPRDGGFGIAVFSRLPIGKHEVMTLGDCDCPAIVLEFDTPELQAHLIAVHLRAPMNARWAQDRNRQLDQLVPYVAGLSRAFVIVGDFNNTPYSPSFRAFVDRTRTKLWQPIWQPTWPSVLGWAGIPIDLAIGSETVNISSVERTDPIGSDHRGLRFSVTTQL